MRILLAIALLATTLAGCSGGDPEAKPEVPVDFDPLELEATETTGVIRGIVVDEAIRPIGNVSIVLRGGPSELTTTSTPEGAFGFDGLEPGAYFLSASKPGHIDAQASTEVVAGVAEPPIVKILLALDTSYQAPFHQILVFEGYIECGVTTPVIAGAICGIPNGSTCGFPFPPEACLGNVTNDNFSTFIAVEQVPEFIQHELVWEATQTTGNMFNLAARWAMDPEFSDWGEIKGAIGVSPVIVSLNATEIEDEEIGLNGTGLGPSIFSGGMEGTAPPCDPVFGICAFSTGATLSQSFRLYTIVFFGYAPPEGWRFIDAGEVPQPPA
jgi:hypothetical protein